MTNSVSQWEIAGSKKASYQKGSSSDSKVNGMTRKKSMPSKIPVIETLKPLELENGIYDSLAVPEEEEVKKPKIKTKSPKAEVKKNLPVSPKQKKEEPVNLLKANIESKNKKKSGPASPGKTAKNELETALSQLTIESFQQKYTQLEGLFPDNQSLIIMHMVAFLNQSLNDIPDLEPNHNHENESNNYPTNKLDKKVEKFLNGLLSKLKKSDTELVFNHCLDELIKNENPKISSNHGHRIFVQMLTKHNKNIAMKNLTKITELIYANRHRHHRIMLALWSLSQPGYHDLTNGMTIWFDAMLPLITIKQYTLYVANYLQNLFDHHKIDSGSIGSLYKDKYIISLDQYLKVYELATDKSLNILSNKEAYQKFNSAFKLTRILFMSNLQYSPEAALIFETLLISLLNSQSSHHAQLEYLEILAKLLFTNTDGLNAWQVLYAKNIQQSSILIDYLVTNYNKQFRNLNNMRETLLKFEKETSVEVKKTALNVKEEHKKPYYINKRNQKSNNSALEVEKFNQLIKKTLKENFKQRSFFWTMFRTFLTFAFITGLFFYWDKTQNRSIYFKAGERQLEKYGLLDDTRRIVDLTTKKFYDAQKAVNYHVPIWYKKTSDTLRPYTKKTWSTVVDYSNLAWKNSEKLRTDMAIYLNHAQSYVQVYFQQASTYVQKNFPVVKKSVMDSADLTMKYVVKASDATVIYTNQAVNYIGTQLLGWKKGELEKGILEAYKIGNDSLQLALQWVTKTFKNLISSVQQ